MARILLLHSALGLRRAVLDFAEQLRERGHEVVAPDFYGGHVFDTEVAGTAHRDAHPEYFDHVRSCAAELPDDTVLAGFSLGAWFAQRLAAKRPRARAAILLHSVTAPRGTWSGVPVQVHRQAVDPWIDPADVDALRAAVRGSGATFEDHVVPGEGHLFTDLDGPDADPRATTETLTRIDTFLR